MAEWSDGSERNCVPWLIAEAAGSAAEGVDFRERVLSLLDWASAQAMEEVGRYCTANLAVGVADLGADGVARYEICELLRRLGTLVREIDEECREKQSA